jgi:hypothetical protein
MNQTSEGGDDDKPQSLSTGTTASPLTLVVDEAARFHQAKK